MSLRENLLEARGRLRREPAAAAPELEDLLAGQPLYVRELTAAERDEFEAGRVRTRYLPGGQMRQELALANVRARLLVLVLCDEQGRRVFREEDAVELGGLPAIVLDRWYEQAARLSGMSATTDEELAKNSGRAGGAGSPSPSPSPAGNGT
jgi:hypothetical protein